MRLLDSDVIISGANSGPGGLSRLLDGEEAAVSAASEVEVLGYHRLTVSDRTDFLAFFAAITVLAIDSHVILRAIALRQTRKMSLGDALIAATALVHDLPLVTRNTRDFSWVAKLTLIDPDGASPTPVERTATGETGHQSGNAGDRGGLVSIGSEPEGGISEGIEPDGTVGGGMS
jgi:toxin FitB